MIVKRYTETEIAAMPWVDEFTSLNEAGTATTNEVFSYRNGRERIGWAGGRPGAIQMAARLNQMTRRRVSEVSAVIERDRAERALFDRAVANAKAGVR